MSDKDVPADPPPAVTDAELDDLRHGLERTRLVPTPWADDWRRGTSHAVLRPILDYWATGYDWREHETRIRAMGWERLPNDETPVRAVHRRVGPDAPTVVLLHGWPDSVLRFDRVIPRLDDVNLVVPALPGFPFAVPVPGREMRVDFIADALRVGMAGLGYKRYVLSAGDVGCDVAESWASAYPREVAALHLTDVSQHHYLNDPLGDLSSAEQDYVRRGRAWQAAEGAYMHEQSTKPNTLAAALGDSPAGTAAWILEKLHTWTDCGGNVETVFNRDELLTWISAYWHSGAIGTSFTPYAAQPPSRKVGRVAPPAVFTVFAHDLVNAPRDFAERYFAVHRWTEYSYGGHFAAWERPHEYIQGVRDALEVAAAAA